MTTLTVEGMSCGGCEANVEDAVDALDGVESVTADHEAGTLTVTGDVDADAVIDAVSEAGYEASA